MFSELTSFGEIELKTKTSPNPESFFIKAVEQDNCLIIKQALNQKIMHIIEYQWIQPVFQVPVPSQKEFREKT